MGLVSAFKAQATPDDFIVKSDPVGFIVNADAGLVERYKAASAAPRELLPGLEQPGDEVVVPDQRDEPTPTETNMSLTTDFLRQVEGFETTGYVPKKDGQVLGVSGVTIGSGIDLGQQTPERLKEWGLPDDLVAKLSPYTGKKKDAAVALLKAQPLKLTTEEADLLTQKAKAKYIAEVRENFDKASAKYKFDQLPEQWQAVITSVGFQYGTSFRSVPRFWKQVTEGRWADAHANLQDFGDQYGSRRRKEARLVSGLTQWDTKPKPLNAADIEVEDL